LRDFARPKVVVSKCIEFEPCRWDGGMISSDLIKRLMSHVDSIPVCPEVEIGLGIPRDPLRIASARGELRLIQPATNLDLTAKMDCFADSFLDSLPEVDGFILKSRSPTGALRDAKIYPSTEKKAAAISKGPGFFGKAVLRKFPHLAVEDEGRLRNPRIKEHFLAKLFSIASFREVKAENSMRALVEFHSENKFLLKAYSQKEIRILGRIVANLERRPFSEIIGDYQQHFLHAFKRGPRCESNANVMMNAMGYFSKKLSREEKAFFLDSLEKYRNGIVPKSFNTSMLQSWIIRFEQDYLGKQTFFEPYPQELVDIDAMTAYCDGKEYWR